MTNKLNRTSPLLLLAFVTLCLSFGFMCERLTTGTFWTHHIVLLMIGAMVVGILSIIVQIIRTHHHLRQITSRSTDLYRADIDVLLEECGIEPNTLIIIDSPTAQAFCFGFINPRICISTGLIAHLSASQLRAVLLHEAYHRRFYHPLLLLGLDAVQKAFFFLPIVGEWIKMQQMTLEIAADRYAVARAGKQSLAGALHTLLTEPTLRPQGVVAGMSLTEARITCLLGDSLNPAYTARSLLISSVVLFVLCMV